MTMREAKRARVDGADGGPLYEIASRFGLSLKLVPGEGYSCDDPLSLQRGIERFVLYECHGNAEQEHFSSPDSLRACLLPLKSSSTNDNHTRSAAGARESLCKVFLRVPALQREIINLILDKLPEYAHTDDDGNDGCADIPKLLVSQLRWLDGIEDATALTEGILAQVNVVPSHLQRELISLLPEVVEDRAFKPVITALQELMETEISLTLPILEVLMHFNLDPSLLAGVIDHVLSLLDTAPVDDIPMVVKFLMQVSNPDNASQIVESLRSRLRLEQLARTEASSAGQSANDRSKGKGRADQFLSAAGGAPEAAGMSSSGVAAMRDSAVLTLEALRTSLLFQRHVYRAYLGTLGTLGGSRKAETLDVWVLLLLYGTPAYRRNAMQRMRTMLQSETLSVEFVIGSLRGCHAVLVDHFKTVLALAQDLLPMGGALGGASAEALGAALYALSMGQFSSPYHRQETLAQLLTHVGAPEAAEASAAVRILEEIIRADAIAVAPFKVFIKGVLDMMGGLSDRDVAGVFRCIALLDIADAYAAEDSIVAVDSDVQILVRKLLSGVSTTDRRKGVVGACALVHALSGALPPGIGARVDGAASWARDLERSRADQAVSVLDTALQTSRSSAATFAVLCDELVPVVEDPDLLHSVLEWIASRVADDFERSYLVDTVSASGSPVELATCCDGELSGSLWMNLDGGESTIALSVVPMLTDPKHREELASLCPHFRLLQACERMANNGSLESIDGCLGCPLYLFDAAALDELERASDSVRDVVCHALLVGSNWCREVINAFHLQENEEMQSKVLERLRCLSELEDKLERALELCPRFVPDDVFFAGSSSTSLTTRKGKRGRPPPATTTKGGGDAGKEKTGQADARSPSGKGAPPTVPVGVCGSDSADVCVHPRMESLRPLLRTMPLSTVHILLRSSALERKELDTAGDTQSVSHAVLTEGGIHVLLREAAWLCTVAAELGPDAALLRAPRGVSWCYQSASQAPSSSSQAREPDGDEQEKRLAPKLVSMLAPAIRAKAEHLRLCSRQLAEYDAAAASEEEDAAARLWAPELYYAFSILAAVVRADSRPAGTQSRCLQQLLSAFAGEDPEAAASLGEACVHAFAALEGIVRPVPSFVLYAQGVSALEAVVNRCSTSRELAERLADLALEGLQRMWPVGTRMRYEQGNALLACAVVHRDVPVAVLEEFASDILTEVDPRDRQSYSEKYPMLTRHTFSNFYRSVFTQLAASMKELAYSWKTRAVAAEGDLFGVLAQHAATFRALVHLTRTWDQKPIILAVMRLGNSFIESFIRLLPSLGKSFSKNQEEVVNILRVMQQGTRQMQSLCAHGKVAKDVQLTNAVPMTRKNLERLIYKVKDMLHMNGYVEAFWMGNLKHRNIRGEEVSSQPIPESDEDASGSGTDSEDEDDDGDDEGQEEDNDDDGSAGEDDDEA